MCFSRKGQYLNKQVLEVILPRKGIQSRQVPGLFLVYQEGIGSACWLLAGVIRNHFLGRACRLLGRRPDAQLADALVFEEASAI